MKANKGLREIVVELGLDPDMLGEIRIAGIRTMVRNAVRSGKGFRDLHTYGQYCSIHANPEVKVKYLEQVIAYKDQEIEFLKKIASLNHEEADS